MMTNNKGLYLTITKKTIHRTLVAGNSQTALPDAAIADEIIEFSELSFTPYAAVVDFLAMLFLQMEGVGVDYLGEEYIDGYEYFMETVEDLVCTLEEEQPLRGTLLRTSLEDIVPRGNVSIEQARQTMELVLDKLTEIIQFQFLVNEVLHDLREGTPIDFEKKYRRIKNTTVSNVLSFEDGLVQRYFFRSEANYLQFLLVNFIEQKPNVARCECCGEYFIPKTARKTLYCDRVVKDGKTCKQIAPRMKHTIESRNKKVIEEFDRARQRMYKRYERATELDKKPSDKDLTYEEYYEWLDAAVEARDKCKRGEMPLDDALRVICGEKIDG